MTGTRSYNSSRGVKRKSGDRGGGRRRSRRDALSIVIQIASRIIHRRRLEPVPHAHDGRRSARLRECIIVATLSLTDKFIANINLPRYVNRVVFNVFEIDPEKKTAIGFFGEFIVTRHRVESIRIYYMYFIYTTVHKFPNILKNKIKHRFLHNFFILATYFSNLIF